MNSSKFITIDIIAGARPNFIKIAPLVHELKKDNVFKLRLVHTGQHYDKKMSLDFFSQLKIPQPDINLSIGSGSQSEQTAGIMIGYEKYLHNSFNPDLCIVVGDVTSTMACSIVAKKRCIKLAHIEAGLRSGDMNMPEEVNRIITDSITDYYFTTSRIANKNLLRHGASADQIYFVGNIMIDTLKKFESKFYPPELWHQNKIVEKEYYLLTLHRPSNVDDKKIFFKILDEISNAIKPIKIIYPVHPRVSKKIDESKNTYSNIIMTNPLPYLEFNYLVKNAKGVITDSGGITEETTIFNVPCLTLRKNTERPETISIGTNLLLKNFPEGFQQSISKINSNLWKKGSPPEKWDGKTAERIASCIKNIFN